MKYEDIVNNKEVLEYYERGNAILDALGYTDHSTIHTKLVAAKAADSITAALIIADKSDVRRSRVREKDPILYDIHDRVNYAVTETRLRCGLEEKRITLYLTIDENICTMYEYFDIFLQRMTMCSQAARMFDALFSLKVNGQRVL